MRLLVAFLTLTLLLAWAGAALGEVTREGQWPDDDPVVSLSVQSTPRAEAIRQLADKAGWSVVLQAPASEPVDVHVKDQPAAKILELLLSEGRWVARRDGALISIARAAGPAPASPPPSAAAPAPAAAAKGSGEDRVVTGGSARVEKGEVVKDLVVMGGSADVLGTVTGDLAVMGGAARVHDGARVEGDATVLGGSLDVENGAVIEGDVGIVGGKLRRGEQAKIGGDVEQGKAKLSLSPSSFIGEVGSAITRTALLFVFGAVLLALATRRMEGLQGEVAGRPMRSFALGVVGILVGVLAFVALCITIIGIPIAIVALLFAVFGAYAGICAVLATIGAALLRHRTKNPYVHLAVGCGIFMLISAIPYLGGFVTLAVVLMGIGAVVATRGAGTFVPKRRDSGPYRTATV